jgi:hypothetical protein
MGDGKILGGSGLLTSPGINFPRNKCGSTSVNYIQLKRGVTKRNDSVVPGPHAFILHSAVLHHAAARSLVPFRPLSSPAAPTSPHPHLIFAIVVCLELQAPNARRTWGATEVASAADGKGK